MNNKDNKNEKLAKKESLSIEKKSNELKNFKVIVRTHTRDAALALSKAGYTVYVREHTTQCLSEGTLLIVEDKEAYLFNDFYVFETCKYREINYKTFADRFKVGTPRFVPGSKILVACTKYDTPFYLADIFSAETLSATFDSEGKPTVSASYVTTSGVYLIAHEYDDALVGKSLEE